MPQSMISSLSLIVLGGETSLIVLGGETGGLISFPVTLKNNILLYQILPRIILDLVDYLRLGKYVVRNFFKTFKSYWFKRKDHRK